MDFKNFKKNRSKLQKSVEKMKAQKPSYVDDRFWALTKDAAYNGEAIIRFLPQRDIELSPVILYFNHSFKHNGKWFWEMCPTTLGQECYGCEQVQPWWDEDTKASKAKAGKHGRKKNFIANILVIKDPAKPENNGKVFLFRFGVKIYDKLMDKLAPTSELVEPEMVHDLWEGRNFHLKCKKVDDYPNYDTSTFMDKSTPVGSNDKEIEEIYNTIYDLAEFTDESKFKEYEAFKTKWDNIMGKGSGKKVQNIEQEFDMDDKNDDVKEDEKTLDDVITDDDNKESSKLEENDQKEIEDSCETEPEKDELDLDADDFDFDESDFDFDED